MIATKKKLGLPSLEQLYQQIELSQIMTRTNDIGFEDMQEWEEILLKYKLLTEMGE